MREFYCEYDNKILVYECFKLDYRLNINRIIIVYFTKFELILV